MTAGWATALLTARLQKWSPYSQNKIVLHMEGSQDNINTLRLLLRCVLPYARRRINASKAGMLLGGGLLGQAYSFGLGH